VDRCGTEIRDNNEHKANFSTLQLDLSPFPCQRGASHQETRPMLQRIFWFPRNSPKSLIHMKASRVLKNSASQAQGPKIKGLAPAKAGFQQSYPQQKWIPARAHKNQDLSADV
jgi:hypothetical protein